MPVRRALAAILSTFALFLTSITRAQPIRVPTDYPTIQEALNVIAGNDTVLVDVGEYVEVLTAPPVRFTLMGNTEPDTGDFPRPTVDASLLPDTLRAPCLTLPTGSLITVENMRFRNRNPMSPFTDVGGIYCFADSAIFRQCAFDSLYIGIKLPGFLVGVVILEDCVFREDSVLGISTSNGTVLANRCLFDGGWGWAGAVCSANSIVRECTFRNRTQYLLSAFGENITISDCVFGPSGLHTFTPVELGHFSGRIENCIFTDLLLYAGVLRVEAEAPGSVFITGNTFFNNQVPNTPAGSEIELHGDCTPGHEIVFANNSVIACSSLGIGAKVLDIRTCVSVVDNRFVANRPRNKWTVMNWEPDSVVLRHNIISENGAGVRNFASSGTIDARQNWWGHATGPYNAFQNPFGQGDSVSNNVLFAPWTADTNEWLAVEEAPLIPKSFAIEVFPNPFNSSATMLLRVPEPTIIQVELFDMLGRRVKEIWSGAVAIEKKIHVDAQELPSGIYFARATEVHFRRPLAAAKLLLIR